VVVVEADEDPEADEGLVPSPTITVLVEVEVRPKVSVAV
jgi:hypothetical protein